MIEFTYTSPLFMYFFYFNLLHCLLNVSLLLLLITGCPVPIVIIVITAINYISRDTKKHCYAFEIVFAIYIWQQSTHSFQFASSSSEESFSQRTISTNLKQYISTYFTFHQRSPKYMT